MPKCSIVSARLPFPGRQPKIRRIEMKRKSMWFVLSAGMMVTGLFHAKPAMATDPVGFTSSTIAKGQFGDIDAFSKFVQPVNAPDSTKRKIWLSRQKTKGLSDGYVLSNIWQPGG